MSIGLYPISSIYPHPDSETCALTFIYIPVILNRYVLNRVYYEEMYGVSNASRNFFRTRSTNCPYSCAVFTHHNMTHPRNRRNRATGTILLLVASHDCLYFRICLSLRYICCPRSDQWLADCSRSRQYRY